MQGKTVLLNYLQEELIRNKIQLNSGFDEQHMEKIKNNDKLFFIVC